MNFYTMKLSSHHWIANHDENGSLEDDKNMLRTWSWIMRVYEETDHEEIYAAQWLSQDSKKGKGYFSVKFSSWIDPFDVDVTAININFYHFKSIRAQKKARSL